MKTIGIVGGLGPESTVDYYRLIIREFRKRTGACGYPHILINSLDVDKGIHLVSSNSLSELTDYLVEALHGLAKAGAEVGMIAANTPHIVFDEVLRHSPVPLISIVQATCAEVARRGLHVVSLLGTRFTMEARFYPDVFEKRGIRIVTPSDSERAYIHDKYLNELLRGIFLPETREHLEQIITAHVQRNHVQGVLLAGTELPLILRNDSIVDVPLLNTTEIHVRAAVSAILD